MQSRPESTWREALAFWAQLVLICLWPIVIVLSHRNIASDLMIMAVFCLLYPHAFASLKSVFSRQNLNEATGKSTFLWVLIFCGYMALSLLWTPVPERASWVVQMTAFVGLSACLLWSISRLEDNPRFKLLLYAAITMIVTSILLGIEGLTGGWIRDVIPPEGRPDKDIVSAARGVSIAIVMAIPGLVAFYHYFPAREGHHHVVKLGLILLSLVGLLCGSLLLDMASNVMAFCAILGAGSVAYFYPRLALKGMFCAFAVSLVSTPFLALTLPSMEVLQQIDTAPVSWVQRLIIWNYTADQIFQSLPMFVFGGGMQFGWSLSELQVVTTIKGFANPIYIMPTHPHNVFLQIWLEFGLVGATLCGYILYKCYVIASRLPVNSLWVLAMILAALFVYAFVEMSLWTLWRQTAFVFAFYLFNLAIQHQSAQKTAST